MAHKQIKGQEYTLNKSKLNPPIFLNCLELEPSGKYVPWSRVDTPFRNAWKEYPHSECVLELLNPMLY